MNIHPDTAALDAFVAACRRAADHGLMRCSSGNLSWRLDPDHMLVTTSRSWMEDATHDTVAVCRIADGECLTGNTPTVETGIHAGVLRTRADMHVVMHFQTPAATAIACREPASVNFAVIPEIPYYIGPVGSVPFLLPGTADLAQAVTSALTGHDMVIMRNHGVVTVGTTFDDVIQKACFFELACDILIRTGGKATPIDDAGLAQLREMRGRAHARSV